MALSQLHKKALNDSEHQAYPQLENNWARPWTVGSLMCVTYGRINLSSPPTTRIALQLISVLGARSLLRYAFSSSLAGSSHLTSSWNRKLITKFNFHQLGNSPLRGAMFMEIFQLTTIFPSESFVSAFRYNILICYLDNNWWKKRRQKA